MDAVKEIRIVDPHVVDVVNREARKRNSKAASKTASQLILERVASMPPTEHDASHPEPADDRRAAPAA